MKTLKPLTVLTVTLSALTILFFGTLITTQSSCTKTPTVSAPVVAMQSVDEASKVVNKLVASINEKISPQKVVLKSDIPRIAKLIPYLIEGVGYTKSEYLFKHWVCENYHFHTAIKITPKNMSKPEVFEIDGKYAYSDNDV